VKDFQPGEDKVLFDWGDSNPTFKDDVKPYLHDTAHGVKLVVSGFTYVVLDGVSTSQLHAHDFDFF